MTPHSCCGLPPCTCLCLREMSAIDSFRLIPLLIGFAFKPHTRVVQWSHGREADWGTEAVIKAL